jgi:hypothetical protein
VGIRPVRLRVLEDGGLTCESMDWKTGAFTRDLDYLTRVVMGEGEVEEVSEDDFNAEVERLRANFRTTGKWFQ